MTQVAVTQTAISGISEVTYAGKMIGKITHRSGSFTPEPSGDEDAWAQDEIHFATQDEAVAFLIGADWMAANAP